MTPPTPLLPLDARGKALTFSITSKLFSSNRDALVSNDLPVAAKLLSPQSPLTSTCNLNGSEVKHTCEANLMHTKVHFSCLLPLNKLWRIARKSWCCGGANDGDPPSSLPVSVLATHQRPSNIYLDLKLVRTTSSPVTAY